MVIFSSDLQRKKIKAVQISPSGGQSHSGSGMYPDLVHTLTLDHIDGNDIYLKASTSAFVSTVLEPAFGETLFKLRIE